VKEHPHTYFLILGREHPAEPLAGKASNPTASFSDRDSIFIQQI
jgi:hypothetical protein